jgi:hypothetical protein
MSEKEASQRLKDQAADQRMKAAGEVCDLCGAPAPTRDPELGRLCAFHLKEMKRRE